MEHTVERYTDCFETFLREPNEATYTQVCAERYRRKQSGQSVDRREERSRFFQLRICRRSYTAPPCSHA